MKVLLRELKVEDAEISWKWRNDPEVWKLTGRKWSGNVTKEIEENWIRNVLKQEDSKRFAICVGDQELYIGNVQLTNIRNKEAFFHIFIGEKQYWGKGIGSIATKLLLDYAKEELKLNTLKLIVKKSNIPAIKIYEKVGFIISRSVDDKNYVMELSYDSH
jgi:RimJ/RimL family protein N-acetyltransferase